MTATVNGREWHFRVRPARGGGFIAWAAQTPDLGDGPSDVPDGEVVYFLLEETEQEALQRLQDDVKRETGAEWLKVITHPARR